MSVKRAVRNRLVAYLTEPLPRYERRVWNDATALRRHVRAGDVLLVQGDNRVSAIIRYLTQSAWSHAALYVGDALVEQEGPLRDVMLGRFGEDARELVLEALPEGVVASPLAKYLEFDIRLMRPHGLQLEHRKELVDAAIETVGWEYDLRNVVDLARFLLPVRLTRRRERRRRSLGSGIQGEVICSSHLGQLFARVGFPILPLVEEPEPTRRSSTRRERIAARLLGRRRSLAGVYRRRDPTLLTPRDFDLSPFFETVKFNVIADGGFDYQGIRWAEDRRREDDE